ncbi:MAG: hypothetical protein KatS3mg059_0310 [Thermomicrobiales bacterium]|nr:MAG: hypothetical protein KatS3mg059_0310 [Thermomicrobiales bacterium]
MTEIPFSADQASAGDTRTWSDDTPEELLEQAQANAQAIVLATLAFLQARRIPLESWAAAVGETLSQAWDEPEPWEAGEFLDAMLTNFRSLGATVVSTEFSEDQATATLAGFPDPHLCDVLGVEPAVAAHIYDLAAPIASARGLQWTWTQAGDQVQIVVRRASQLEAPTQS